MQKYRVQNHGLGKAFSDEEKERMKRVVEIVGDGNELMNAKRAIAKYCKKNTRDFDALDNYDGTYTCFYRHGRAPSDDYMGTYKVEKA